MQAELPPEEAQDKARAIEDEAKFGRKCDTPINEGLMKIMGDLGIDTNMTRDVSDLVIHDEIQNIKEQDF